MKDNVFKKEMLDYASKLDAVTNSCGEITKAATAVADEQEKASTLYLVNLTSEIIRSAEYSKEIRKLASIFKDSIMKFYGYIHIMESAAQIDSDDDTRDLSELLKELDALIGLTDVKSTVNNLIAYQKVKQLREHQGLYSEQNTMHLAFTGNPGTGKTTVARIIGHIYKQLGLLSKGHFIEVSRTDLIAGYQGQTALKVKKVVEQAMGGVLFIDEAYSITENDHSDSYGRECLTELTKALEDYRNDLVVIVAGYTEPMKKFFNSNPGLKSRFNTFIEFKDFSGFELNAILNSLCKKNSYEIEEGAAKCLEKSLIEMAEHKDEQFANGRLVRNIFDDLVMNHARRVVKIENATRVQLMEITVDDIPVHLLKTSSVPFSLFGKEFSSFPRKLNPLGVKGLEGATEESVNKTKIYREEFADTTPMTAGKVNHISVEAADSVSAILAYRDRPGRTAVLNFASFVEPGGGCLRGAIAQEEYLCYESNLYFILAQFKDFYADNRKDTNSELYYNRCLYSPDVQFMRELHGNPEQNGELLFDHAVCDVITCAAPFTKAAMSSFGKTKNECNDVMKQRCKFVLDVAKENDVQNLILGAFGCGVFGNDPVVVSTEFRRLLKSGEYNFEDVIFAIPESKSNKNLDTFRHILM